MDQTAPSSPNPYAPPLADVQDVMDPRAPAELADRGTRLAASIVDGVIMAAMLYAPFLTVLFIGSPGSGSDDTGTFIGGGLLLSFIGFSIWCWLTVRNVLANGQSIAKKLLGIKVVRSDGSPASLARIFWLRNVVNTLLSIVPFYQLVDCLLIFAEPRQCVHDKIADTIVVRA